MDESGILVRDTKAPQAGVQRYTPAEWHAFVVGVKRGEFDVGSLGLTMPE